MTSYLYLSVLIFSLLGLFIFDYIHKVVICGPRRNEDLKLILATILVFLLIDYIGVITGVFWSNSSYISGLFILPGVPIEEVFFLTLFGYFTLLLWRKLR